MRIMCPDGFVTGSEGVFIDCNSRRTISSLTKVSISIILSQNNLFFISLALFLSHSDLMLLAHNSWCRPPVGPGRDLVYVNHLVLSSFYSPYRKQTQFFVFTKRGLRAIPTHWGNVLQCTLECNLNTHSNTHARTHPPLHTSTRTRAHDRCNKHWDSGKKNNGEYCTV